MEIVVFWQNSFKKRNTDYYFPPPYKQIERIIKFQGFLLVILIGYKLKLSWELLPQTQLGRRMSIIALQTFATAN